MEFHRVCSISLVRGGKNSNETLICPGLLPDSDSGHPAGWREKAHTLPHQSLIVICCVVHIYPFRRPDVKMKEKPKGVNRKITNDGEEKSGKMKKLILIRGDKRFLYSAIHLARFDSYSDNTATPGLIRKTTSCHRMVMLRHLIWPAPSRRPNTGSAQSTGNKQLSQFSAHFYLISFTRIPLSCSSVMVLPALK